MFYKKVNYDSNKECFEFLTNHFTYYTLNSWNNLKSIANNVKVYHLPVDDDLALKALEEDDYFSINETIRDWEVNHPGYRVAFNGHSGGMSIMTGKERLKAELMIFAIKHDFFGYGSTITRLANGKYKAVVDCETYYYTLKELANEFNNLDTNEIKNILNYYYEKELDNNVLH